MAHRGPNPLPGAPPLSGGFALSILSAEHIDALPGVAGARRRRHEALDAATAIPLPSTAAEEWRYSRIDDLDLDRFRPAPPSAAPGVVPDEAEELLASLGDAAATVVTVDGSAPWISGSQPGLTIADLTEGDGTPMGDVAGRPDIFAALNEAGATAPLLIRVDRGAVVRRPVVVIHVVRSAGVATFPRTVVRAGDNAEAVVVEIVVSADVDSLVVPVTELDVAPGAHLGYTQVQLLGPRMTQLGHLVGRGARDSTLTAAAVALGGDYARLRTASTLAGPGASSRLLAVYFGAGRQMHDFRTVQDHRAPRTTSDLLYKGAVANRSQSVYTGLIRVEKGARGTNAYQTNRNLVLHDGAHADSVPNLEIEDNDVRCSHASAVGPIAADQRFYLESRGVPTPVAERLITLGFLDEVLTALPGAALAGVDLVPLLRRAVATKLEAAEAAEAGSLVAPAAGGR